MPALAVSAVGSAVAAALARWWSLARPAGSEGRGSVAAVCPAQLLSSLLSGGCVRISWRRAWHVSSGTAASGGGRRERCFAATPWPLALGLVRERRQRLSRARPHPVVVPGAESMRQGWREAPSPRFTLRTELMPLEG